MKNVLLKKEELEIISDCIINKIQIYNNLKTNLPSVRLLQQINQEIETLGKLNSLICSHLEN